MRAVNFIFRAGVDRNRRTTALEEISAWSSIHRCSALNPEASDPVVQRMGYVYVDDDADVDAVVQRLQDRPEIESASIPARRRPM